MPLLLLGCGAVCSPCILLLVFYTICCAILVFGYNDFALSELILFFTDFLAIALACQRFFHSLLLARFQVKGMALDFLDDVFSLHLAFETAQGILKGFAFLNSNFCQRGYTSKQAKTAVSRISLSG